MLALTLSGCGRSGLGVVQIESTNPNHGLKRGLICSKLDFFNYSWPQNIFDFEVEGFQLALNITSSFEGHEQWQNISTNFDNQGLSMGLLNQNLGTSSLQPLLIRFRNHHEDLMKKIFLPSHLTSLLAMLKRWEGLKEADQRSGFDREEIHSNLDTEADYSLEGASADSVKWAQKTLYDKKGDFIPAWKSELQNLVGTREYIDLQIEAAWLLHKKTLYLFRQAGVPELRSYLLMYDFVVQNGNIYTQDWEDYLEFIKKNPQATAAVRLEKLLELRLRHVKPQYVNDVRTRKSSIIHGQGRVHGVEREYEKEFCFNKLRPFSF